MWLIVNLPTSTYKTCNHCVCAGACIQCTFSFLHLNPVGHVHFLSLCLVCQLWQQRSRRWSERLNVREHVHAFHQSRGQYLITAYRWLQDALFYDVLGVRRVSAAAAAAAAVRESVNTTTMASCSVCADQLSRSALTERLCDAEFGKLLRLINVFTVSLHRGKS